jgi:predicted PurR-regulated permease PerM
MNMPSQLTQEIEKRASSLLVDAFIRVGLIAIMLVLCYQVFSPFLTLMIWALILAITMYPLHQMLARKIGWRRKQGLAATILLIAGIVLIVTPTALLMNSFGDSIHDFVGAIQDNTLEIPAPRASVKDWPLVGEKIYSTWSQAHADLPGVVQSMQPKIGDLTKKALSIVASLGIGLLQFLASFMIAGVLMAYGESGARGSLAIFNRIVGAEKGVAFVKLSTATIRTVANGVIGVAFIQSIVVGLVLLVAGVPWAGVLAAICLVLGIAQVPAVIVILPAIVYIWSSGNHSTGVAVAYTILLLISGLIDNVLKPLMLGRGVDSPMPVILFGALGGMAAAGILGMFVGAMLLALGYQIFMSWVATNPDSGSPAV